ncbi:Uncharacterised protein [Chlamydia trachomatis]|nr:Uncharacterised protein [Chlamydia trachomatis]
MANSLVSTVPTAFLAVMPFFDNKTGVAIGPQPPPPVASQKPAKRPNGMDCFAVNGLTVSFSFDGLKINKKRNKTYTPRPNKNMAIYGFANSAGRLLRKHAPTNAPIEPGMIKR